MPDPTPVPDHRPDHADLDSDRPNPSLSAEACEPGSGGDGPKACGCEVCSEDADSRAFRAYGERKSPAPAGSGGDAVEVLRPWLKHHQDGYEPKGSCYVMPSVRPDNPHCTCGLAAALASLPAPAPFDPETMAMDLPDDEAAAFFAAVNELPAPSPEGHDHPHCRHGIYNHGCPSCDECDPESRPHPAPSEGGLSEADEAQIKACRLALKQGWYERPPIESDVRELLAIIDKLRSRSAPPEGAETWRPDLWRHPDSCERVAWLRGDPSLRSRYDSTPACTCGLDAFRAGRSAPPEGEVVIGGERGTVEHGKTANIICGHRCCDWSDAGHDHFLRPADCPKCARLVPVASDDQEASDGT